MCSGDCGFLCRPFFHDSDWVSFCCAALMVIHGGVFTSEPTDLYIGCADGVVSGEGESPFIFVGIANSSIIWVNPVESKTASG